MTKWYFIELLAISLLSCACTPRKKQAKYPYPFSNTAYTKALSYPNREIWDTVSGEKGYMPPDVITNGKVRLDPMFIEQTITLNPKQQELLFAILTKKYCEEADAAMCYAPRHLFILYNNNDSAITSVEICFMCNTIQTFGTTYVEPCPDRMKRLEDLLENIGINYWGEGEDSLYKVMYSTNY